MAWETVLEYFFPLHSSFVTVLIFIFLLVLLYSFLLCFHCIYRDALHAFDTCIFFHLLCQKLFLPCSVSYVSSLVTCERWFMLCVYMFSGLCYHPSLGLSKPPYVIFLIYFLPCSGIRSLQSTLLLDIFRKGIQINLIWNVRQHTKMKQQSKTTETTSQSALEIFQNYALICE